jgi:UPF0716 protein FxsA
MPVSIMLRYLPAFLLIGFVLEISSIIWVGARLGVIPTLLLLLAGGMAGISLFRSAGMTVATALRSPMQHPSQHRGLASVTVLRIASGLLFLVPGFFSDAVAALLLMPPVQKWLGSRMKLTTAAPIGGQPQYRSGFGPVIEAEAIEIQGEGEVDPREGKPPERY